MRRRPPLPKVPPLKCPDCGAPMALQLRPESWRADPGRFVQPFVYLCLNYRNGCEGKMSAHPDGLPHGIPAPKAIRRARNICHGIFDPAWTTAPDIYDLSHCSTAQQRKKASGHIRKKARQRAYRYMAEQLNLPEQMAHLGMITDIETLRDFYRIAAKLSPKFIRDWAKQIEGEKADAVHPPG